MLKKSLYGLKSLRGFINKCKFDFVFLLQKLLYGLKRKSPRQWYKSFVNFVITAGFTRYAYDCCLYFKRGIDKCMAVYLLLYIDEMLLIDPHLQQINEINGAEFEMKYLGHSRRVFGKDIIRNTVDFETVCIYWKSFIKIFSECMSQNLPLASHFKLYKQQYPIDEIDIRYMKRIPYANTVGSIMYTMVCAIHDVFHAISTLSKFMANLGPEHWEALNWLPRYLKGIT